MRIVLVTLIFFTFFSASAQREADLSSPYAAVKTFIDNLQPEISNDSLAAQPFKTGERTLGEA